MAVPDPHMEDLCLTTYDARPRVCKTLNRVPRRNDFIEVLWCIDQLPGLPERWCTAEVLHVSGSPEQDILADGVIRYIPDDMWNEEIHIVEFLRNNKLRRTGTDNTGDEEMFIRENLNPPMDWQFTAGPERCSAPSDDDEWMEERSNPFTKRSRTTHALTTVEGSERTEIKSLRTGYAALIVEIEKVKRQFLTHSKLLRTAQNQSIFGASCSSAGCVLQRLQHRLGLKMQSGLRTMCSTTGKRTAGTTEENVHVRTGYGMHVDALRVRVESNFQQFECIARRAKASVDQHHLFFSPDFSYTQLPSRSSSAFRIMFATFYDMASLIGVTSLSDLMEMTRKCGNGLQGDILRVLGTYKYDAENHSSAASIYLGTSCGHRDDTDDTPITSSANETTMSCNNFPILERQSRKWNKVDRRFTHPPSFIHAKLPHLDDNASRVQAFSLEWKRMCDLGSRTWSRSMTQSEQIFGWLEVTLPFVQVEGRYLCEELGGLANDDVREALLDEKSSDKKDTLG